MARKKTTRKTTPPSVRKAKTETWDDLSMTFGSDDFFGVGVTEADMYDRFCRECVLFRYVGGAYDGEEIYRKRTEITPGPFVIEHESGFHYTGSWDGDSATCRIVPLEA